MLSQVHSSHQSVTGAGLGAGVGMVARARLCTLSRFSSGGSCSAATGLSPVPPASK